MVSHDRSDRKCHTDLVYSTEKRVETAIKNWHMLGVDDQIRDVGLPLKNALSAVVKRLLSTLGPQLS